MFNRETFNHMLYNMNFGGLPLDEGLRVLLQHFRLPGDFIFFLLGNKNIADSFQFLFAGESQQIDRILEQFAQTFYNQNPEQFESADVVFVLSFSLIMLNTDLHNRSLAEHKKMRLDQFLRNNRDVNYGAAIPREVMEGKKKSLVFAYDEL